jgi:hypothetical protein
MRKPGASIYFVVQNESTADSCADGEEKKSPGARPNTPKKFSQGGSIRIIFCVNWQIKISL